MDIHDVAVFLFGCFAGAVTCAVFMVAAAFRFRQKRHYARPEG